MGYSNRYAMAVKYFRLGDSDTEILYKDDTDVGTTSSAWIKLKEFACYFTRPELYERYSVNLKFYWEFRTTNSAYDARSRFYIDDVAFGSEYYTYSTSWVPKTQVVTINKGDTPNAHRYQIFGHNSVGDNEVRVRNFRCYASLMLLSTPTVGFLT